MSKYCSVQAVIPVSLCHTTSPRADGTYLNISQLQSGFMNQILKFVIHILNKLICVYCGFQIIYEISIKLCRDSFSISRVFVLLPKVMLWLSKTLLLSLLLL